MGCFRIISVLLVFGGLATVTGASYRLRVAIFREELGEKKPEDCRYGIATVAGVLVCAKGPGERCGGYYDLMGKCGDGMVCDNCGYCRGCSSAALLAGRDECYSTDYTLCDQFGGLTFRLK